MQWIDWYTDCSPSDILSWQSSSYRAKVMRNLYKYRILHLNLSSSIEIRNKHVISINSIALDRLEERFLLSGGGDGIVSLYDLEKYRQPSGMMSQETSSNCNIVIPRHSKSLSSPRSNVPISCVQWHPIDAGLFVLSTATGRLQVWDPKTYSMAAECCIPGTINTLTISPHTATSSLVAVGTNDNDVTLFDMSSWDATHKLIGHGDGIQSIAWSITNPYEIISGSGDGSIKLWDIRKAGHHALVASFDWRQDHSVNMSSETSNLVRHDESSLRKYKKFYWSKEKQAKAHDGAVKCLSYSSCGRYIISSGNDRRIRLWQASNGELLNINYECGIKSELLSYSFAVASFDREADDLLLFPSSSGNIIITPVFSHNGKAIKSLYGHIGKVTAIVYRKSYQQIISCGRDKMIFLWESASTPSLVHPSYRGDQEESAVIKAHHLDDDSSDGNCDQWSDVDPEVSDENLPRKRKRSNKSQVENAIPPDRQFFMLPIIQSYIEDMSSSSSRPPQPSSSSFSSSSTAAAAVDPSPTIDQANQDNDNDVTESISSDLVRENTKSRKKSSNRIRGIDLLRAQYAVPSRIRR
jgi:DNA excision repair protein ERCC-8